MSNCCMRRPAKFHVDRAVRFLAIANIREGGVKRPSPGQARLIPAVCNCRGKQTIFIDECRVIRRFLRRESAQHDFDFGDENTPFGGKKLSY